VAALQLSTELALTRGILAARGIELTNETVRCWTTKVGMAIEKRFRSTALGRGDKRSIDEVVVTINGKKVLIMASRRPARLTARRDSAAPPRQDRGQATHAHAVQASQPTARVVDTGFVALP
jgi:hypothetical protein